jgi:nucleoside 2-deoxyribosyltransferase
MAFSNEMTPIFEEGFLPALRDAGFEVILVNRIPHNDKIDDRIIAEIRRSGLVVADFTGQRQNVYFEAGFALGLGRHLICTCRTGSERDLHFDIRQYNHVVWNDAADLRQKLRYRVEATIPGQARRSAFGRRA